ncbi:hypothetical protein [Candidatus Xenohaliotis californiensis]
MSVSPVGFHVGRFYVARVFREILLKENLHFDGKLNQLAWKAFNYRPFPITNKINQRNLFQQEVCQERKRFVFP